MLLPISKEVSVVNIELGLKTADGAVHQDVVREAVWRCGGGAGYAVGGGGIEGVVEALLAGDGADGDTVMLGSIVLSLEMPIFRQSSVKKVVPRFGESRLLTFSVMQPRNHSLARPCNITLSNEPAALAPR